MRIILSIFALSMFLSCQEDTNSGFRQCGRMILSDALPVQFWLSECDTFNQHEAGGVHHVCWCQPWNCDDEINLQFQDTAGVTRFLLVYNSDEDTIQSIAFAEISSGIYALSFIPSNYDICDQQIRFEISGTSGSQLLTNADFTSNITGWTNVDSGDAWFWNAGGPITGTGIAKVDLFGGELITRTLTQSSLGLSSGDYYFEMDVVVLGTFPGIFNDITMYFDITDASSNVTTFTKHIYTDQQTPIEVTFSGLYSGSISSVGFRATRPNDTLSISINVNYARLFASPGVVAKSDCLDISESHDETILIEYSNQTNFAGLIYENESPEATFGIRVPCRFFHEIEPEEDEAMELTSSVIITSAQVKTQRLLEVKHAPYYFHKKLRRVLKHQTITIFDKQWKKEEKYEVIEGKKTWPLKAATCLLTEKNSVVRNVS